MQIVVVKPSKFVRSILKFVFGIKKDNDLA